MQCLGTYLSALLWHEAELHNSGLAQGTVGFVKFDIKDINSVSCPEPEDGIRDVAQVAMLAIREVLIAGGCVNKVNNTWRQIAFTTI